MSIVLTEQVGTALILTINRPQAFNALNADVLDALEAGIRRASADPEVRAVVITGAGEKAFCAGADVKELDGMDIDTARTKMARGQAVMRSIEQAPVPVIAAVNGLALGGGFELTLATTFPVISEKASLGLPEAGLGLIPGYGGTQRLARVVGRPAASYLMLTTNRISAQRAYDLGLTPVPPVPVADVMAKTLDIAGRIAEMGPEAVRAILQATDRGAGVPLDTALMIESSLAAMAIAGKESGEGVSAFLQKRPASFPRETPVGAGS